MEIGGISAKLGIPTKICEYPSTVAKSYPVKKSNNIQLF